MKLLSLIMPNWMRLVLNQPQGKLFTSRAIICDKDLGVTIDGCVGDIVCSTIKCKLAVVDGATMRSPLIHHVVKGLVIVNPRGAVTAQSISALSSISGGVITVIGEEDLLLLPLAKNPKVRKVVYGQPGVGVVLAEFNLRRLKYFKLLKAFKPGLNLYQEQVEGQ
ncbi:MAG: DUF359 domain-containing protein [Desulfurococcaceae archaeon]|nr:GTP-dependent dephospho-CoA kinase family protein [Sulfolobales archaeon]MDW8170578.1 DUF359 domain-containing protein [Desulfurococcaceae archaeon]